MPNTLITETSELISDYEKQWVVLNTKLMKLQDEKARLDRQIKYGKELLEFYKAKHPEIIEVSNAN